jgi:hypothetical protein
MIFLGGLGAPASFGQSASSGTVAGQVTDEQNAAIPAADVKITDTSTSVSRTTTTNEAGRYIFSSVPPGNYNVSITKNGFTTFQVNDQTVEVGQSLTINAVMHVGSTSTTVEVSASAGAELQTMNATVGTTIGSNQILYLPSFGRDASTFATLQPGVAPNGAVAGVMYDQNTFQLDGGNNSSDMDGSQNIYTGSYASNSAPTGAVPTPAESIEEFKVATNNQTADFNGSAGSQVQMVTKRGANQFHGSVYEYYYSADVGQANTWKNNHTPSNGLPYTDLPHTHRNRFGGALGGPITDKSLLGGKWFFFFKDSATR